MEQATDTHHEEVERFNGAYRDLTRKVIGRAMDVHARLGPGLLESAYKACLQRRLALSGLDVKSEVPVGIEFDGISIETAYRADLIVEGKVLVELKATERLLPIHRAQTRTYLKHCGAHVALLINFDVINLLDGIRRFER
jgi:GxxExxY protein